MPLRTTSRAVLARIAALTAICAIAGGTAVAVAGDQPAPQEPSSPAATRYFDIEANKAASMRALGLQPAEQGLTLRG